MQAGEGEPSLVMGSHGRLGPLLHLLCLLLLLPSLHLLPVVLLCLNPAWKKQVCTEGVAAGHSAGWQKWCRLCSPRDV